MEIKHETSATVYHHRTTPHVPPHPPTAVAAACAAEFTAKFTATFTGRAPSGAIASHRHRRGDLGVMLVVLHV